jgi:hypothetical protein
VTAGHEDFARRLIAGGVPRDPSLEDEPRFTTDPLVLGAPAYDGPLPGGGADCHRTRGAGRPCPVHRRGNNVNIATVAPGHHRTHRRDDDQLRQRRGLEDIVART